MFGVNVFSVNVFSARPVTTFLSETRGAFRVQKAHMRQCSCHHAYWLMCVKDYISFCHIPSREYIQSTVDHTILFNSIDFVQLNWTRGAFHGGHRVCWINTGEHSDTHFRVSRHGRSHMSLKEVHLSIPRWWFHSCCSIESIELNRVQLEPAVYPFRV